MKKNICCTKKIDRKFVAAVLLLTSFIVAVVIAAFIVSINVDMHNISGVVVEKYELVETITTEEIENQKILKISPRRFVIVVENDMGRFDMEVEPDIYYKYIAGDFISLRKEAQLNKDINK